jgi:hypothetical protein
MNKKLLCFVLLLVGSATLFAAVTATALIRRIDFSMKQSPLGEQQYLFLVQATQVRFGNYGGTCKFYVELKDGNGKHYFGTAKLRQANWPSSGGYAVTYAFPVNIGEIDKPAWVAYAAELELENVVLNNYKQNVADLEQWKAQCASLDKVHFDRLSYQNH